MATITTKVLKDLKDLTSSITSIVTVKLDGSNYSIWYPQMSNIILATEAMNILDGSLTTPETHLATMISGERPLNPAHKKWLTADRYLKSCLMATISPTLITEVSNLQYAHQIWKLMVSRYTTISESQAYKLSGLQIKEALQLQLDVQRQLHDQLEIQRNLQLRIEEQGKQLKMMFDQQQRSNMSQFKPRDDIAESSENTIPFQD